MKIHPCMLVVVCCLMGTVGGDVFAQEGRVDQRAPAAPSVSEQAIEAALAAVRLEQWESAARHLETAMRTIEQRSPLRIRKAVVVQEPPKGFGQYLKADGAIVRDRVLRVYVELSGHQHMTRVSGAASPTYDVSLAVRGEFFVDGESLGERSLGEHRFQSRSFAPATWFAVDAKLGDQAPAGEYEVLLKVRDVHTQTEASRRVRFFIPRTTP